jgi:hypothetical protein
MIRFIARVSALAFVAIAAMCAAQDPRDDAPTLRTAAEARLALDGLISAYERADIAAVRALLDPGYLGYQKFIDGAQRDFHASRLVRIHLRTPRMTSGTDVAVLQLDWEKRFMNAETFEPMIATGHVTVLMHRSTAGWRLAALHGESPFGHLRAGVPPTRPRNTRTPSPTLP